MSVEAILRDRLNTQDYIKLMAIDNPLLHEFIADYIVHCNPEKVFVCSDSPHDLFYIREAALFSGEEKDLPIEGHTIHFDGYNDQGRDVKGTQYLLPKGMSLGPSINSIEKEGGVKEVREILADIMKDHVMYVRFFCLGPTNSPFSIPSVQLTDSAYVAHSLDLLYRQGYEEFRRLGRSSKFFRVVHSQGELENFVSKNIDKRRIYIDIEDSIVYSVNTQYGGNSLGLKKLSMRLAIKRASEEGWLCEHMFLMGVHGPNDRKTYFTGAFPSLCGKTSTSMMLGESIVGDDIVYMRVMDDVMRAVNVEKGMFGIIMGINSKDDPIIYKALHSPNEIIFSNILITPTKETYWIGKDGEVPPAGINHSGEWVKGKKDAKGDEIPPSHKNARFTLNLNCLENLDPGLHDPQGYPVGGIIYGGRDSDTLVPILEAFDWTHGIISIAASLESETTAATLGQEGVRKLNPMSNLDFLSIPIGKYIQTNLDFGAKLSAPPKIFGVNYFLKDKKGVFLNEKTDKGIWLKWMERRVHNEVDAIKTPTGFIPLYEDLKQLFKEVQNKEYTYDAYVAQYTLRIPENIMKIGRILIEYGKKVPDAPVLFYEVLNAQLQRLIETKKQYGDYVTPAQWKR